MWVIDVVQKAVEEGEGSSTPKCLGLGVSETLSSSSNCRSSVATRHDHPEGVRHWFSEESETVYYVDS